MAEPWAHQQDFEGVLSDVSDQDGRSGQGGERDRRGEGTRVGEDERDEAGDLVAMTDDADAEGRDLRGMAAGCGTGCLTLAVAIGVLVCLVGAIITLFVSAADDLPASGPWRGYVAAALGWAVGAGCVACLQAYRGRRSSSREPVAWLVAGLGGIVLAAFWPVLLAALLIAFAVRPSRDVRARGALAVLAGVAVIGGSLWGVGSYQRHRLRSPKALADTDVAGTWRSRSGAVIVLQPDGGATVTGVSGLFVRSVNTNLETETGTWRLDEDHDVDLTADGEDPAVRDLSGQQLRVYDVGSTRVLCAYVDLDAPCRQAFYRS